MERKNVMMDAEAWDAAQYLAAHSSSVSVSAVIRQAIKEQARRKGWKPERARQFLERRQRMGGIYRVRVPEEEIGESSRGVDVD